MKSIFLFFFTISLVSCEGIVEPDSWDVLVKGDVTEYETGAPIDSVEVHLWKWEGYSSYSGGSWHFYSSQKILVKTFTDTLGNYSLNYTIYEKDFPSGVISINARALKEGYWLETYHKDLRISSQGTTVIDFQLHKID